jgi:LmbE family N-acetylglucosaminyl deacetylase
MSTRSRIARLNADGSITSIYCHSDGYLEHNGKILRDHYRDSKTVDALLALGALSMLGTTTGEQHDFDWSQALYEQFHAANVPVAERWNRIRKDPRAAYCRAYHRDRGEELAIDSHADHHAFAEFLRESDAEYAYLWNGDGWLATTTSDVNWVFVEKLLPVEAGAEAGASEEDTRCIA